MGVMDLDDSQVPAAPPVEFRSFTDYSAQRQSVYARAQQAFSKRRPLENATHRLEVVDVGYEKDYNPTKREEKEALLHGRSLHRPLKGTVRLVSQEDGAVVDEQRATLARIPHLSSRGLFVRNGVPWVLRNQSRLRPGVYTRTRRDGGVEAHFNIKPGTGRGFRLHMDPKTGIFKFEVGQSTTKLYPVLRALGVPDEQMKEAWGEELFNANFRPQSQNDLKDTIKLVEKLSHKKLTDVDRDLAPQLLQELVRKAEIDPDTAELTLGKRISHLSPDQLLGVTKRVIRVSRHEDAGDNRDSQAVQSIHGAEDFIEERLIRDQSGALRNLLWKASREGKLPKIGPGLMDKDIGALFDGTGLAMSVEDINPFEIYDSHQAITRLGEGGISSETAVSRPARGVQASYLGVIDAGRGPESSKLGLDLRLTDAALKGSDNQLYTTVRNLRTGEDQIVSARELSRAVVAFPGELSKDAKRVPAMVNDEVRYVDRESVDYELPSPNSMMSRASAMIPFPESVKGQRLLMGSRMMQQAVPLVEAEAPLIQSAGADGTSLYAAMGEAVGAVRTPAAGTVLKVTPDAITVRTDDGQTEEVSLYNYYPSARKTYVHNTPLVQPGDRVDANQLLARSNFTNDKGELAIGRNARVAFMAAEGDTLEDAFVVSESMAKKLRSQAMYKPDLDLTDIHSTKKNDYRALYTDKYNTQQYERLDEDGVVVPGQIVQPGDPVILAIGNKPKRGVGAVMNTPRSSFTDKTVEWDHHAPGVVTDVSKTRRGIKVHISSEQDVQPGDKLSGRYGNKGVISAIRPDDQMPMDENGEPIEVILNSLGIISRVNPGALAEAMLGKAAAKVGENYIVPSFSGENVALTALHEALKHGVIKQDEDGNLIDAETMTDPRTGKKIPGVFTGVSYILKPHHMAESKLSARDQASYTLDGLPAKGSKEGSKRIATLDTYSLLAAGATEFLKDAKLIRGQRNDEYWRAIRAGETPIVPSTSFANEKFKDLLRAAGVNLREKGSVTQLTPLTDDDVEHLARHEIKNSKTFDFETMRPEPGGLFDVKLTGGADGNLWSKITLPTKVPHPLFMEPIQRILGLTGKTLNAVLAGQEKLGNKTGPEAVESALKALNVDRELSNAKQEIQTTRGARRDAAVRRLNFLTGLKNMEVPPDRLMISQVPVIPPKHRPVIATSDKDMINDLNYLYHDLMEARDNYAEAKEAFGDAGDEYLTMMHAHQAVVGKHAPVTPQSVDQGLKGILQTAIGVGDTPKRAHFQRKVIGSAVDTVGRSVITSDPNLDMDQVSIPEDMAWKIYRPYVIRRMIRLGSPATEALKRIDEKDPAARRLLEEEMKVRPVVYNRAPSLHQYSYVAGYPILRKDDSIGLSYYTLGGMNADFDGDSCRSLLAIRKTICPAGGASAPSSQENAGVVGATEVCQIQDLPHEREPYEVKGSISKYRVAPGVCVYAYNCDTNEHNWAQVTEFSVHRDIPMRSVVLGHGSPLTLTVSEDHSLLGYTDDGRVAKLRPDDALHRMVPVAQALSEPPDVADSTRPVEQVNGVAGERTFDLLLDRAFGRVVGMLLGSGWQSARDSVFLDSESPELHQVFRGWAEGPNSPLGEPVHSQQVSGKGPTPTMRTIAGGAWFARWLGASMGADTPHTRIPGFSLNAPNEHLLGILDGILSAGGVVSTSDGASDQSAGELFVGLSTSSPDVRDGLVYLCRRLGIRASVTPHRSSHSERPCFRVSMPAAGVKLLVRDAGFMLTETHKQSVLVTQLAKVRAWSTAAASQDVVPYPRHLHSQLLDLAASPSERRRLSTARNSGYWPRGLAQQALARETTDTPEFGAYRALVDDTAIVWRQVTKVEDAGVDECYDITVPGPYTFATADGVFVQDTVNIHVPSSDAAVEDAREKLLPSKNLIFSGNFETRMAPVQDYLAGLYLATAPKDDEDVRVFEDVESARKAYHRGDISLRTPIRIREPV